MFTTLYVLWFFVKVWFGVHWGYAAMMHFKKARDAGTLTTYWKVHGYPLGVIVGVLDVIFNFTFGLMFAERPHEWFFSKRVQRHVDNPTGGWRHQLGCFYGRTLNVFDDHIHRMPPR